jgi:hypothetical protein
MHYTSCAVELATEMKRSVCVPPNMGQNPSI